MLKRLAFTLVLLMGGILLLTGSQPRIVFTERPIPQVEWEMASVYNNYIGGPITVVFRVTVPVGVTVNFSFLPNVGDKVSLYRILPPAPPEIDYSNDLYNQGEKDGGSTDPGYGSDGEVEVRDRMIRQRIRGNQRIIEVTYTFQYLQPIDFTRRFTEKLIRSPMILIRFQVLDPRSGGVRIDSNSSAMQDGTFYLVRRVEAGDQPIGDLVMVRRSVSPLPAILRLAAAGLLVGTFTAQGWSVVRRRIFRRRGLGVLSSPSSVSSIAELYASWQKSNEYGYFVEAVRLYREGFWSKLRPLDWVRTTFILYSGRVVSDSQIKEIFEHLVSLDREKVVEEVRREFVP